MDANQNQLNNALSQVHASSDIINIENQKQAAGAMDQHMQERASTASPGGKTGTLTCMAMNLCQWPTWLGQ